MKRDDRIDGAPFQPGGIIRVVRAIDAGIHDVSSFIGRLGLVKYLEYDCGCGQTYPIDPMIGVKFSDGTSEEFWSEELCEVRP